MTNQIRTSIFAAMNDNKYPRIIFLGTPDFAVASLSALVANNFNVVAVVTAPDKPAGRGRQLKASAVKEYSINNNLPVLQPEKLKDPAFLAILKSYNADLQVVVAFRMLPEVVWNMPPLGTINVHGSLLPNYRGAAPINWAIINGENETGVTTFKLKHAIDTGDILLQSAIPILHTDNMGSMYNKLMHLGAELLVKTLHGIVNNTLVATPQHFSPTNKHAPKIFKEDCLINWEYNGQDIVNKIRGLSPIPVAFTYLNEKSLKIYEAIFEPEEHTATIGTFKTDHKSYIKFACKDGWVIPKMVQLEGKKSMTVEDFLRGYQFQ